MKHILMNRFALSVGAAALLAGCALRQAQGDTRGSGVMPQTAAHRASAAYQQLYRFHPQKDGSHPTAGLLDVNGTLYGTTERGGLSQKGTIYRITTSGVQRVIYRFHGGSDGFSPVSGVIDVNGTLYGTTYYGGGSGCENGSGCGTVYSVSTRGTEKVLYAFKGGSDGAHPIAGLINVSGTLYGTTAQGGGTPCNYHYYTGCGTLFSVTTSGQEAILHRFASGSDGALPTGELVDVKGALYGTTSAGGNGLGTVYRVTPSGSEKVLYAFRDSPDGAYPDAGLVEIQGTLYGTTSYGGANSPYRCAGGCGTVYSIGTRGSEKVLYSFQGGSDGEAPQAALINVNGLLYGTTQFGGGGENCFQAAHCGTIYSVTTAGIETVLYGFAGGTDGFWIVSPLTNVRGTLYGTSELGGDNDHCCHGYGYGTVFTLTP